MTNRYGILLKKSGQRKEAVGSLIRSVTLLPGHWGAWLELVACCSTVEEVGFVFLFYFYFNESCSYFPLDCANLASAAPGHHDDNIPNTGFVRTKQRRGGMRTAGWRPPSPPASITAPPCTACVLLVLAAKHARGRPTVFTAVRTASAASRAGGRLLQHSLRPGSSSPPGQPCAARHPSRSLPPRDMLCCR